MHRISRTAWQAAFIALAMPLFSAWVQDAAPAVVPAPSRTMEITRPYLHLPVKNGAPKHRMRLRVGGRLLDEFDIELAGADFDFLVFVDLSQHLNETLTAEIDAPPDEAVLLEGLSLESELHGAEALYQERYRPQFHFSPRRGWNNDPNGLVYYQGEYHLYFQHNPYGREWGNMHWGHAVSRDLVHWEELPVALNPRAYGDWAFSGSGFIDWKNTGGFQDGPEPPLAIAYTSTGRGECIAYSDDRGRTFTEFPGNPVVKHVGRDPKVQWHAASGQWVMAVYEVLGEGTPEKQQTVGFYTSPDLKAWTHRSNLDGYYECPELFALPVDGDPANSRWVVYAANNEYTVGEFDGITFTPDGAKLPGNCGNCLYAAQTFSDIPAADGRRIEIGWGRIGEPSMPFNQMMTFPTSLTLRATPEGIRLFKEPVREIAQLHRETHRWENVTLQPDANPLGNVTGELFHVEADLAPGDAGQVALSLRGVSAVYDVSTQTLRCLDKEAPLPLADGAIQLEILVDRLSVEIFGNRGALYMPLGVAIDPENHAVSIHADSGHAVARSLAVHTLGSAWR